MFTEQAPPERAPTEEEAARVRARVLQLETVAELARAVCDAKPSETERAVYTLAAGLSYLDGSA